MKFKAEIWGQGEYAGKKTYHFQIYKDVNGTWDMVVTSRGRFVHKVECDSSDSIEARKAQCETSLNEAIQAYVASFKSSVCEGRDFNDFVIEV